MLYIGITLVVLWACVVTALFLDDHCAHLLLRLGWIDVFIYYCECLRPLFYWTRMLLPVIGWLTLAVMVALCLQQYVVRQQKKPKAE